jgi:pimeloyl-ACP methyl ester carboxylesterase
VWGAADYADAVAAAAREVDEGPYLLVGHSFGGRVSAHLAADHPDLVAGVVFVGTPLLRNENAGRPKLAYRLVRSAHRRKLVPDATMERYRQKYGSADYRAAEGVMRDVLVRTVAEDYRTQLGRITAPVGFCWGELDTAAPADVARRAAELVADPVMVEIVPGIGHDVHRDAPEALQRVIDAVARAVR